MKKTLFTLIGIFIFQITYSQLFKKSFDHTIEVEAQRFLMEEVFEVPKSKVYFIQLDRLISKSDNVIEDDDGGGFILTYYNFNRKVGVVLSSVQMNNKTLKVFNLNLSKQQFLELDSILVDLDKRDPPWGVHYINRFDTDLIMDVFNEGTAEYYSLWVNGSTGHVFQKNAWEKAVKKFKKYIK